MADKQKKATISSVLDWVEHRWKIVLGFVITLAASLSFYLRSKDMKKVLDQANNSHDKENNANDEARKKLSDGLQEIKDNVIDDLSKAEDNADKKERQLRKEKKEFIKKAKDSETLASDIADRIGADFVEND